MKKLIKISALLIAIVCMSVSVQAQKFGYMNSQLLLSEMSEVKQANANLETFQKQIQQQGQNKLQALQTKYQEIQQKVERGELSPKQQEEEAMKLRQEEAEIGQFEQEMIKKIQEKEAALLQPILDKVNTAIKSVAEENGYTYIFDASTSILLYAQETTDVSSLVKAKLGI